MKKIAILGFGVVGSGVAEVLTQNKSIIEKKLAESIEIKYILDLRDFPDSQFADKVVYLENAPIFDISATEIRKAIAEGRDISDKVIPEVEKYIRNNKLW